ncbi:unnamed protein product [Paramecium sonneborni]|uniref:Uncharacterized protein n=1 Tax=Paramecium sonneborni TaxID=65129 RepID=A0A8S1PU22_9CILI|nr:unnamed protein product [Paramecium sonneborni]
MINNQELSFSEEQNQIQSNHLQSSNIQQQSSELVKPQTQEITQPQEDLPNPSSQIQEGSQCQDISQDQQISTLSPYIIKLSDAKQLYKTMAIKKDNENVFNKIASTTMDCLPMKLFHIGTRSHQGSFINGDQCERIIEIKTIGKNIIFQNDSYELAILEWKPRADGVKPNNSGELLKQVQNLYPDLLQKYYDQMRKE